MISTDKLPKFFTFSNCLILSPLLFFFSGDVFGSKDYFYGLGVFFDTYSNHNGEHQVGELFPVIRSFWQHSVYCVVRHFAPLLMIFTS